MFYWKHIVCWLKGHKEVEMPTNFIKGLPKVFYCGRCGKHLRTLNEDEYHRLITKRIVDTYLP